MTESIDLVHDPDLVDDVTRCLTEVFGRHVGMVDRREADILLSKLADRGVTLAPPETGSDDAESGPAPAVVNINIDVAAILRASHADLSEAVAALALLTDAARAAASA